MAAVAGDRYAGVDSKATAVLWSPGRDGFVAEPLRKNCSAVAVRDDGLVVLTTALRWLLWDPFTGASTAPFPTVDGMQLLQQNGSTGVSSNGRFFYLYWDDLLVYDTASGALLREGRAPWYVYATSLSDDGRLLLMGGKEGWVGVAGEGDELVVDVKVGEDDLTAVSLSRDGRYAAWLDGRGRAGLIEVASGRMLVTAGD